MPYREFGVHFSLATVTEKPMRWNSRSLRHLPPEQLKHWRRSSTNWRQLSASSPACTAAPLGKSLASKAEERKCSCTRSMVLSTRSCMCYSRQTVGYLRAKTTSVRKPHSERFVKTCKVSAVLDDIMFMCKRKLVTLARLGSNFLHSWQVCFANICLQWWLSFFLSLSFFSFFLLQ